MPIPSPTAIVRSLRKSANPERRKVAEWYFPSAMQVLGVPIPALRQVVREVRKHLKTEPAQRAFELAQALVETNVFEARQVGYELIETHATALDEIDRATVEALGRGMDNWASVDSFATSVAGRAWHRGRLTDATIRKWARSKDPWWRRAGVVSTVPLNLKSRGGSGDTPRTLMICTVVTRDRHEMVHKGLSWALRSLIEHDRTAVQAFVQQHEGDLASRVLREVRTKLRTGKKN